MQDIHKVILAVESFLKELQHIGVIKEFSLQPLKSYQSNLNQFKSAFMTFTHEMNNVLSDDVNTTEQENLQPQNSDLDSNHKENKKCNRDSKDSVEIQVDITTSDTEKTALQPQNLDMDSNQEKNKNCNMGSKNNVEIQVNTKVSDTKTAEMAVLELKEISDMDSNHEKNKNCVLYSKENIEIQVNTRPSDINTTEKTVLEPHGISDMDSNQEDNKSFNMDSKVSVEIQMDTTTPDKNTSENTALKLQKKSDIDSIQEGNRNCRMYSKDNLDILMDAAALQLKNISDNDSTREDSKKCNVYSKDNLDILMDAAALQLQKISDIDSTQEESKKCKMYSKNNLDILVDAAASDSKTIEKVVTEPRVLDMDTNPKENKNCNMDLEDNMEIQVDTETSNTNTSENAALRLQKISNMDSTQEENKNCKLDPKDKVEIQMDIEASDAKTRESKAVQLHYVSDMDSNEETQGSNFDSKDNIQIQVSSEELKRRIIAFKLRKRKLKDEKNVQEYCGRPFIDELNPLWGEIDTCARIDAVFIPRFDNKSRVKVSRVANRWGPQTQSSNEVAKRIKTEPGCDSTEHPDKTFEAIQERLQCMEAHVKLKLDSTVRKNIFERMKELEDRILYLEGISPDYFNLPVPENTLPKKNIDEKEKMYANWSINDVQKRIEYLRESLRAKSAAMKDSSH